MRQTYFGHMGIIGMLFLWAITDYSHVILSNQTGPITFLWFLFIFAVLIVVSAEFVSSVSRWFK